jgi:hypothetical protein
LVTPHNREYALEPRVTLIGSLIPVVPTTKILGVTIDRGMTLNPHVTEVVTRARSRLNVLKALSSTTFGHSKESQTALYKQFVRPVLSYASPAWAPDLARTHMEKLQRTQNVALRIATGCCRSTPLAHLHAESKVLTIKDHLDMRGTQLFASASCPGHPLEHLHHPAQGRRRSIHSTPADYYGAQLAPVPPPPPGRTMCSWLHEFFVTRSLDAAPPNSLLQEAPPAISPVETSLPRSGRVHLARLRCGHHPALLAYQNRIRPEVAPTCRWCGAAPEEPVHLFTDCPELDGLRRMRNITSVRDLWENPVSSLALLREAGLLQDPN